MLILQYTHQLITWNRHFLWLFLIPLHPDKVRAWEEYNAILQHTQDIEK